MLVLYTDPLLPDDGSAESNGTSIYDDLDLVFIVYFGVGYRPDETDHDFNCTLPITYYDINENVSVALGMYNSVCTRIFFSI